MKKKSKTKKPAMKKTAKKSKTTKRKPMTPKGKTTTKPKAKKGTAKKSQKKTAMRKSTKKSANSPRSLFETKVTKAGKVVTLGVPRRGESDLHHLSPDLDAERTTAHAVNELVESRSFRNQMKAAQTQAPIKQPPLHAIGHGRKSQLA